MSKKVALIVLDGWGIGKQDRGNAVFMADTPFMDHLLENYPHSELLTHGEHVGLPEGQMGNSEVGHLNIGAGRVVYQDLVKINKAVADGSLEENSVLTEAMDYAKTNQKKLHFIGLVSMGGVHSSQEHLHELCDIAGRKGLEDVYIHAFTDGRDRDPQSGKNFIADLQEHLQTSTGKVASVIGRYYAMDRDKRWERIQKAYDLMVHGKGTPYKDPNQAVLDSYANNITDEFIEPAVVVDDQEKPLATIEPGDVVICFNFRTDRCRQITEALTQKAFPDFGMEPLDLKYITMTRYDDYKGVDVLFDKENIPETLGEVVSKAGKSQLRMAETEKYPHVTFFFSGGQEEVFPGEDRMMVNSPKVATYDLQPEMSAAEVADGVIQKIKSETPDFICLNFANPDMVGHTGDFKAVVKALETVDHQLSKVVQAGLTKGYTFVILADHGNADFMVNPDGSPNTAHTMNPVPLVITDSRLTSLSNGVLADVAPTILKLMGITRPAAMTGKALV